MHESAGPVSSSFQMSSRDRKRAGTDPALFLKSYAECVSQSILAAAETLDVDEAVGLVERIEQAENVFLFGFDSILDYLKRFQSSLSQCSIGAYLSMSTKGQIDLAHRMKEGDLCLVVSSFGQFFKHRAELAEAIAGSAAHTVLLTQSSAIFEAVDMDETVVITQRPDSRAGSFNMEFYLEYLARLIYMRTIGKEA